MKKPIRRLLAGLTLATAAAAGTLTVTNVIHLTDADTAWGAPATNQQTVVDGQDTTDDTAWGTPPPINLGDLGDLPIIPLDTAWG